MPDAKQEKYKSEYGFNDEQINIIISNSEITNFIDEIIKISKIDPKKVINYFISSLYVMISKENFILDQNKLLAKRFL